MDRLDLNVVWQLHTPAPRWGMVKLHLPRGTTGLTLLDGDLPKPADPIRSEVVEDVVRFGDVVGTGWASVLLISPAVQGVLAPFSGWRGIPIASTDDRVSGYVVLGQAAEKPGGLGIFVDPMSWDGGAIFRPGNRRGIWMIGSVASALRKAKGKGISVERYVGWEPSPA